MKTLSIDDLKDIVVGATFLGSGGGGSPENGLKLVEEIAKVTKEVKLVSPDEVPDNEYVAMIAGMGAPKALKEKGFGPEALHAFCGLEKLYSMIGVRFKYIMPGETGGFNSITPIYVAAIRNLVVVDADGTGGRAVPELGTTLYNLYGLPVSPFVVADKVGNIVVGWLANPLDGHTAEEIARHVTVAFGMLSGLGTWVVIGWQVKNFLEPLVLTKSLDVGRALREAKEKGRDPVKAVLDVVKGYELFRGKVEKVELRTVAGFDFGRVIVLASIIYLPLIAAKRPERIREIATSAIQSLWISTSMGLGYVVTALAPYFNISFAIAIVLFVIGWIMLVYGTYALLKISRETKVPLAV
ncbi:MAG: DUF917 domain-containing protein [Candidatus Nezhaarchaeota archaeon]|nr:DUF917 domain-containing protein [Candidatus Nezhaarchaeota archaeon]